MAGNLFFAATVFIFGLAFGSFLNVVIYRLPRNESLIWPASHCPYCQHQLAPKDNIPLLSFLLLKGQCRYCQKPISWRYPLVELLTALLLVAAFLKFKLGFTFFTAAIFLLVLMAISFIDIDFKIIPNKIIIPSLIGFAFFIPVQYFTGLRLLNLLTSHWYDPIVGFLLGGGFLFLLALLWPGGMGGGDIKLAAFMGLFLGGYTAVALFIGFLLGSLGGLGAMLFLGKSRKDQIPFGPYLALGSVLTLFFGPQLVNWYLTFLSVRH